MIMAQVSLYPLRQEAISPAIMRVVEILGRHHLEVRMGEMSTMIRGDEGEVFAAIQEAFHAAAALGDAVMTVTISNACPAPKER